MSVMFKRGKVYRFNAVKRQQMLNQVLSQNEPVSESYKVARNLPYITFVPLQDCQCVRIPDKDFPEDLTWTIYARWCDEL